MLMTVQINTTIQKSNLLVLPVKSNALVKKLMQASRGLRNEFIFSDFLGLSFFVVNSNSQLPYILKLLVPPNRSATGSPDADVVVWGVSRLEAGNTPGSHPPAMTLDTQMTLALSRHRSIRNAVSKLAGQGAESDIDKRFEALEARIKTLEMTP